MRYGLVCLWVFIFATAQPPGARGARAIKVPPGTEVGGCATGGLSLAMTQLNTAWARINGREGSRVDPGSHWSNALPELSVRAHFGDQIGGTRHHGVEASERGRNRKEGFLGLHLTWRAKVETERRATPSQGRLDDTDNVPDSHRPGFTDSLHQILASIHASLAATCAVSDPQPTPGDPVRRGRAETVSFWAYLSRYGLVAEGLTSP